MVIKPEDRQLLADFVNNLSKEQRREILDKLLKSILSNKETRKGKVIVLSHYEFSGLRCRDDIKQAQQAFFQNLTFAVRTLRRRFQ